MPPKPPRIPPYLYSWNALINAGMALMVVAVDGLIAVAILDEGNVPNSRLALFAGACALALLGAWRTARFFYWGYVDWQKLRRDWDELNDLMNRNRGK